MSIYRCTLMCGLPLKQTLILTAWDLCRLCFLCDGQKKPTSAMMFISESVTMQAISIIWSFSISSPVIWKSKYSGINMQHWTLVNPVSAQSLWGLQPIFLCKEFLDKKFLRRVEPKPKTMCKNWKTSLSAGHQLQWRLEILCKDVLTWTYCAGLAI